MVTLWFLVVAIEGIWERSMFISPRLPNCWMSSLVRGAIERICCVESNLVVPLLCAGTRINESMRLRDVELVLINALSGMPLVV